MGAAVKPDLVTTLPEEKLVLPGDGYRPNRDRPPKPFGKYGRFLARTWLLTNAKPHERLQINTPLDVLPLARWLASTPPASVMVMSDVRNRVVAVHRASPGFEDAAGRVIVLSSLTSAGGVFLAESSADDDPFDKGEIVSSIARASMAIRCVPVTVVDGFAVGRSIFRSRMDGYSVTRIWGQVDEQDLELMRRLENEFDARCVLARSPRWTGKPGPLFSRKIVEEACEHMKYDDQESMVALSFDGERRLVAIHEAARGAAEHVSIGPRDLLKVPILVGAESVAVVHNHPSGVTSPSSDDERMSKTFDEQAACAGIELLGSFIVGRDMSMTKVWP